MAGGTSVSLLHDIQVLFDAGTASGLSDRNLLERFISRGDASAFEVLVLRHGPMVLRVCRNRLPDPNDAQDAFQATFLILVRRSGSIRRRDSVGSWLYGVASRVSARLRSGAARRRGAEERAAARVKEAVDSSDVIELDREEYGPIVQEEVLRLPEKYRAVVVLCYWEGLTHEQAAVQLGVPLGTVRSRMARARDLLRRRLTRRGLAPLGGAMASALDSTSVTSSGLRLLLVPTELVQTTVRAATQVASGQAVGSVVTGVVASLVQRVIWSMTMMKFSGMMAGVVVVGLAGYGIGIAAQQPGRPQSAGRVEPVGGNGPGPVNQPPPPQIDIKSKAPSREVTQAKAPSWMASDVDGEVTIISIPSKATAYKKGEVICELDSSRIRDQLPGQTIAVETAKAAYQNAKLTREVAEIAVIEYTEGGFVSQFQDVEGDIQVGEAELALAEEELKAAKDAGNQVIVEGSDKSLAIKRAKLDVVRAKTAIDKCKARRSVLVDYTKGRTIKQLEAEVEKVRGDELIKQAIWDLEKTKQVRLERQIANCTILAPSDGYIKNIQAHVGMKVQKRQSFFEFVPSDEANPLKP